MAENNEKSANSSSHERVIKGYLTPKNSAFFKAYIVVEELKCSEAINIAVKEFSQKFTPEKRQEYIEKAKSSNKYK